MGLTKEDKQNYVDMAIHFLVAGALAFMIAALGSAVKASWVIIPVATGAVAALSYFGDTKGLSTKDRLSKTIRWAGVTFVFTLLAVLFS